MRPTPRCGGGRAHPTLALVTIPIRTKEAPMPHSILTSPRIERPAPDEHVAYYGKYIALAPGDDAFPALATQHEATLALLRPLDETRALHRYAPGKWSVKEVVGHLIDGERVFGFRALWFARGDQAPLPGFEENIWVPAGGFDRLPLAALIEEWSAARASTIAMFRSFDEAAMLRRGEANGNPISVRALGWII